MTTSIEQQLDEANTKLLQASCDLLDKDGEIERLNKLVAALHSSIGILDRQLAQMRRSTLKFRRDQTQPGQQA